MLDLLTAEFSIGLILGGGGGGLIGWIVTYFFMSKKDRVDANQTVYQNARDLMRENNDNYLKFKEQLESYVTKVANNNVSLNDFTAITSSADKYFAELNLAASAVLDKRITNKMRENTFMPLFVDAIQKSLPAYYEIIEKSSKKLGFSWGGKLRRENYAGIYDAVEKFRPTEMVKI